MHWPKHVIMMLALTAVSIPILYPLIGKEDEPASAAIWFLVMVSTGLNLFVIIYHYCVPPHPKFTMVPWRRWVLRVHLVSGSIILIAGLTACFLVAPENRTIPATIMALTAICFHIPSALLQTPIVFGAKAIMTPAYLFCIGLHGFCAINLFFLPTSEFWLTRTFLIFNIYVWCRFYFYFFDWLRLFATEKYTISILAAGMTLLPALLGPAALLYGVLFIAAHVLVYRFMYIDSPEKYRDFVRERARDSAVNSEVMGLLALDVDPDENKRLARKFFESVKQNGDDKVTLSDLHQGLLDLRIPEDVVEKFVSRELQCEALDFMRFFDAVWSVNEIRRRAAIRVAAQGAKSERDKAQVVFHQIDLDKDGQLTQYELKPLLTEWGLPESEVRRYLDRFDGDRDGAICFDEFFSDMKPVWQFIYYDVVQAKTTDNTEMLGRFAESVKDARTTQANQELLKREMIGRVIFLEGAQPELLDDLAASLVAQEIAAGEMLFEEGHPGDTFFVVRSGLIEVVKGGEPVARLAEGACIGEGVLLSEAPRSASVVAITDCELFALTRSSFRYILSKYPGVAERLGELHARRRTENISHRLSSHLLDRLEITEATKQELALNLADKISEEVFEKDELIFCEGDAGDRFYVIAEGVVKFEIGSTKIAELGVGSCFGEGALISDEPRSASAVAMGHVITYSLQSAVFDKTLEEYPGLREALYEIHQRREVMDVKRSIETNLFLRTEFLKDASEEFVVELAGALQESSFRRGDTIFDEGSPGDDLYLIESGAVRISSGKRTLADIGKGGSIGEGSLLSGSPHSATATALANTIAYRLRREDFQRIIKGFPAIETQVSQIQSQADA